MVRWWRGDRIEDARFGFSGRRPRMRNITIMAVSSAKIIDRPAARGDRSGKICFVINDAQTESSAGLPANDNTLAETVISFSLRVLSRSDFGGPVGDTIIHLKEP